MLAFCVEASHERGMGHLFRALVLADLLKARGAEALFVINDGRAAAGVLEARGYRFVCVDLRDAHSGWEARLVREEGVRVWVNDRLDTDLIHAKRVIGAGARLVTFDDRGGGARLADLNVVALVRSGESPAGKRSLSGLKFLVLDPAIARFRRERRELRSRVVTMGGSDTYGLTISVVRALGHAGIAATVILGPGFRHEVELAAVLDSRFTVKRGLPSLAAEFAAHDMAITAGGNTLFEAAAAGLPCIVVAAEPWELDAARLLEGLGACIVAGYRGGFDSSVVTASPAVAQMSRAALAALDVEGATRVAGELLAL